MIMVNLESIRSLEKAGLRSKGYYEDYLKVASEVLEEHLMITEENRSYISNKYPEINPDETSDPDLITQGINIASGAAHGIKSMIKTGILRKGRATDKEYEDRLKVCNECPGNHAVFRHERIYTCGSMIDSLRRAGKKTCGCVLDQKARDREEDCPFGYWPTIEDK